jgi:hypothetical protein
MNKAAGINPGGLVSGEIKSGNAYFAESVSVLLLLSDTSNLA